MNKEDIAGILGIITLLAVVLYGVWWMAVGSYRNEYAFCKKEYMANKATSNGTNFSEMFDYCYEQTY